MTDRAARVHALEALLRAEGIPARGDAAGAGADIAVIAGAIDPARIRPLSDRVRALGFRFITIELDADA
jgi:hypothetical protein